MTKLSNYFGALLLALGSSSVSATVINQMLDINFSIGPLSGQQFWASLSYDDTNLTGSGDERLGPTGGITSPEGVLSFSANIDGALFDLADSNGSNAPTYRFQDGDFVSMNGGFTNGTTERLTLSANGTAFFFVPSTRDFSRGTYATKSVPIPSTLAIFGLGLAGIGWSRRKKA